MDRIRRLTAVALILAAGLLYPGPATAGPWWDWLCGKCPPPSYCPFRYWTPTAARAYDCVIGPHLSVYPPDRHPEVPATMAIINFPCPPAPPGDTLYPAPVPPPESRFQYFERRAGSATSEASTTRQP